MARTPRALEPFSSALSRGALVFDGAMGTALHARGVPITACVDEVTLSDSDKVRAVHAEYLEAGAQVLGTNSFGANRFRLGAHRLGAQVRAINRAAVRVAHDAAAGSAYVVGSIGPTGLSGEGAAASATIGEAFLEQCQVLVDEGVDGLSLETFRAPEELWLALEAALQVAAGRVPVLASVSFDPSGTLADGTGPEALAEALKARGADALGVNCAAGPDGMLALATRMLQAGLPVVVQPSAGLPANVDGQLGYPATPERFGRFAREAYDAGIRAVGGCCGTTAAHVREIRSAVP